MMAALLAIALAALDVYKVVIGRPARMHEDAIGAAMGINAAQAALEVSA
jgi:hypothetical protein